MFLKMKLPDGVKGIGDQYSLVSQGGALTKHVEGHGVSGFLRRYRGASNEVVTRLSRRDTVEPVLSKRARALKLAEECTWPFKEIRLGESDDEGFDRIAEMDVVSLPRRGLRNGCDVHCGDVVRYSVHCGCGSYYTRECPCVVLGRFEHSRYPKNCLWVAKLVELETEYVLANPLRTMITENRHQRVEVVLKSFSNLSSSQRVILVESVIDEFYDDML